MKLTLIVVLTSQNQGIHNKKWFWFWNVKVVLTSQNQGIHNGYKETFNQELVVLTSQNQGIHNNKTNQTLLHVGCTYLTKSRHPQLKKILR